MKTRVSTVENTQNLQREWWVEDFICDSDRRSVHANNADKRRAGAGGRMGGHPELRGLSEVNGLCGFSRCESVL